VSELVQIPASTAALPQVEKLRQRLRRDGAAGYLTLDPDQQVWLTGFRALTYSRPIVLFVGEEETRLIVPELERRHSTQHARVDAVSWYAERPGEGMAGTHAELLDQLLEALPPGSLIAVDEHRLPMAVAERLRAAGHETLRFGDVVREQTEVKLPAEIEAVRRAAGMISAGVRASLEACRPGASELEVDGAGAVAILAAASELADSTTVELLTMTPSGVERTLLPHVFSSARRLEPGDALIHTRQLAIDGYRAELERTAFVGEPSADQAAAFEVMMAARRAATEAVSPAATAADVDRAAREVITAAGWGEAMPCRTGHGIAISVHEHPHLRFDNEAPLSPGMVLTIEPGFYVPGLGGFRHSDTVLVTEHGVETLTEFPSSLSEMTFPA
jgi:Xaa-Pro dipeptidase